LYRLPFIETEIVAPGAKLSPPFGEMIQFVKSGGNFSQVPFEKPNTPIKNSIDTVIGILIS
jgi:hypothetical protein